MSDCNLVPSALKTLNFVNYDVSITQMDVFENTRTSNKVKFDVSKYYNFVLLISSIFKFVSELVLMYLIFVEFNISCLKSARFSVYK